MIRVLEYKPFPGFQVKWFHNIISKPYDQMIRVQTSILIKTQQLKLSTSYWSVESMDTQKGQPEKQPPPATAPSVTSCRKKKSEEATFLEDLKDHIDEFIHASMDEHKTCFKKTVQKMFGLSKVVAERNSNAAKEVESSLPLQTTVQD